MDKDTIKRAISHLSEIGDTDVLPTLFEFQFYRDRSDKVAEKLAGLVFSTYQPVGAFEVLSPKSQTSFRIAHQLYATDALLYTSAAIDIAPALEILREDKAKGAFSHRFDPNIESSKLFYDDCSFHEWLVEITGKCSSHDPFKPEMLVLATDISDFFSRIYSHRIEHVFDDIGAKNSSRTVIENIIKNSRARQSYGLPVGSCASRIIAEGVLIDVDTMLRNLGVDFIRYVDDFRIFVGSRGEAHSVLCRLAEYLMLTEGLSLNASKTRILTRIIHWAGDSGLASVA